MALEDFNGRTVAAGEPVTAEAWNELVDGVRAVNTHVRESEASGLLVVITLDGVDPSLFRVTAVNAASGSIYEAAKPIPGDSKPIHSLPALPPGSYDVRADASGFQRASATVELPTEEVLTLTPVLAGAIMPDLFGAPLGKALELLKDLGLAAERILDGAGRDVAPANPGGDFLDLPVLSQSPVAGVGVAKGDSLRLMIAASQFAEPPIRMIGVPRVIELTLDEARETLESFGLALGDLVSTSDEEPEGNETVIKQSVDAGKEVPEGTEIDLAVTPGRIQVPSVVNLDLTSATRTLGKAGLVVGLTKVTNPTVTGLFTSIVESQDPRPETEVDAGTAVNLSVRREPRRIGGAVAVNPTRPVLGGG